MVETSTRFIWGRMRSDLGGERWRRGGGQETRPPQGRGGRKENKNLKVGLSRIESDRSRARTFQQERAEKTEGGKPQQFVSKSRRMEDVKSSKHRVNFAHGRDQVVEMISWHCFG